jgi:hypothetical protein
MNFNYFGKSITLLVIALLISVLPCLNADAGAEESLKARAAAEKTKIPFPKPQSHSANWLEYHGRTVDAGSSAADALANPCITCHQKTDCISCHNTRAPRDHTNTWRTLSHGFMAEGNRDRCLTCHRQDFCIRCHNETAPRSHTGGWSTGFTPRHCRQCHFEGGFRPSEPCNVCHRTAPHNTAPHAVDPRANCTQCHQ